MCDLKCARARARASKILIRTRTFSFFFAAFSMRAQMFEKINLQYKVIFAV
jgi:hypothetical protein